MADFEAPSFSLGFDFEPQIDTKSEDNKPPSPSNHFTGTILDDADEDFETLTVIDSESENQDPSPKLKRLRRGFTAKSKADLNSSVIIDDDDDDIDDFSSQEDIRTGEHLSTHHPLVCNSSKFPLNGPGVLTKQPGKRKQNVLNDPESIITSCNKPPFPKLTVSPLRRFQLLDSDSDFDDPFISASEEATNTTSKGPESRLNRSQPDFMHHVDLNEQKKLKESVNTTTKKDLWEDFPLEKSFHIPTPTLDKFCKEYFSSMKDKSKSQSNIQKNNQNINVTSSVIDLGDPRPPAHQYFFHADPRVQNLVRTRLPNFYPLNAANRDSEQPSTSNIDYIGQFSNGEKSKQAARTNKAETSSRKASTKSKTQETSRGVMNPKPNTRKEIPKDAGKRRVQADGQAVGGGAGAGTGVGTGHWFTNQDGKRVYVSKNGQELTGRPAYMLYKKERGGGFKNKKAKRSSTKKK